MRKPSESKVSRVSKVSGPESVQVLSDETRFRDVLSLLVMPSFPKPIDLFIKYLKFEAMAADFESEKEENEVMLLATVEFNKILDGTISLEDGIESLSRILTKDNIKLFRDAINKTPVRIKKASQKYNFVSPKEELWLHKTGKMLKSDLIRPGFVTNDAFGQIKDDKKGELVKPRLFKEMEVKLETKQGVAELLKGGDKKAATLAWPDKAEIRDCQTRLLFIDPAEGKMSALYCKTESTCLNLKDNAIIRRVLDRNKNLGSRFQSFRTAWKMQKAEYFYRAKLRPFFSIDSLPQLLTHDHRRITDLLDQYLRENYPNLYVSNHEPQGVFSFINKTYLNATTRPLDEAEPEVVQQEIIKRQFATLINPEMYSKPDSSQISLNKKRIGAKSPFTDLAQPIQINEKQITDAINLFKVDARPGNLDHPDLKPLFDNYTQNCKILLRFYRILIENAFNRAEFKGSGNEVDEMVFEVEAAIDKGNFSSRTFAFVNQVTDNYLALNFVNSFKVDYPALRFVKIKISERVSGAVVFDQIVSLMGKVDSLHLENWIEHEVELPYRGIKMRAVLCFSLVMVPKNLEAAHAVLSRQLIHGSIDRFDLIVKKSDTYQDLSALLFTPEYVNAVRGGEFDCFTYLHQGCPLQANLLVRQFNQYLRSFRASGLDFLKDQLKRLLGTDLHINDLLLETIAKVKAGDKLGSALCYDLFIRALDLLSIRERFLVNHLNFTLQHAMFINLEPRFSSFGYSKPVAMALSEALAAYFALHPHIRFSDQVLIHRLTFEMYLHFENNSLVKMSFRIQFLKQNIPLIAHLVLLNGAFLTPPQLLTLCIHAAFSTMDVRNYSDENQVIYLDSLLTFFKLAFKTIFPDQYAFVRNFVSDFETQFMGYLANSFADLLPPVAWGAYQDFKQLFQLVVLLKHKSLAIARQLDAIGLGFCSVVDVLFLMAVIVKNFPLIKSQGLAKGFGPLVSSLIRKEALGLREIFQKVLEFMDYATDRDFFADRFRFHNDSLRSANLARALSIRNVYLNVKSLKIDHKVVTKIIQEEVGKNASLRAKVQSLFVREEAGVTPQRAQLSGNPTLDFDALNQDVFFETFEGIEEFQEETAAIGDSEAVKKSLGCLVYLNNLDYGLVKQDIALRDTLSDLNNVAELSGEEVTALLSKYIGGSQVLKMEVFQEMANINQSKTVPLLSLMALLVVSSSESLEVIKSQLNLLARILSGFVFPEEPDKILAPVAAHVTNEFYKALPVSQLPMFLEGKACSVEKDLQLVIRQATIELRDELVDVTELCMKHFLTSSFLNKRPSILFGRHFCLDLVLILEDLRKKALVDHSLRRFELMVSVSRHGQQQFYLIPFLAEVRDRIAIICKYTDTIFFNDRVSPASLVTDKTLNRVVEDASFLHVSNSVAFKLNLNFVGKSFLFRLKKFDLNLTVRVTFVEAAFTPVVANLVSWGFKTEDGPNKTKFDETEVSLDVDFYSFFMNIENFVKMVVHRTAGKLKGADFAKLVRMNNEHYEVTSNSGKSVDPRNYFYDLADFERSLSKNQSMVLNIGFLERG